MSDSIIVKNNGVEQEIDSLADLAGLDISLVEGSFAGFAKTPNNVSLFKVIHMGFEKIGDYVVVQTECEVEKCYSVKSDEYTTDTFIGYKHVENIFIKDIAKDIPLVVGFMKQLGMETKGTLDSLFDKAVGQTFVTSVKQSHNKRDPDKPYVNMDIKGIVSQEVYEAT